MLTETQTARVQATVWDSHYITSLPDSSFAYIDKDGNRHLPYKDADGKVDLPHVRNALARLNQVKGLSDEERAKIKTKLQNALKDVKAADDMVFRSLNDIKASAGIQAADGTTQLPDRVHLLRDGTFNTQKYGEVPIAPGDLYEMKFNFDQGVGMAHEAETGIPIDYSHESHKNAAGWIRGLEVVQADDGGTELWGTNVEWSDSGKAALLGKEYKCLSSDFYPAAFGEWVDPESGISARNVIVGAALTNRPLMTGNKPVIASEVEAEAKEEAEATGVKTVIYVNASETIKEKRMNFDQLRLKELADLSAVEYKHIEANQDKLSDDERKKFGLEAAAPVKEETKQETKVEASAGVQSAEVQAAELKAAQEVMAKQAEALKAAQESLTSLQATVENLKAGKQADEEAKITAEVTAHAERGAIKPEAIEGWVKMILAADEPTREMLRNNLSSLTDNPLLGKKFGSEQSEGSAAMDVEAEISKKVKELMAANSGLNATSAREQVLAANPDLEARANEAARAAFSSFDIFGSTWTGAKGLRNVNANVAN